MTIIFSSCESTLKIIFSLNEVFHDHDLLEKGGIRLETNAYLDIHRALLHVRSLSFWQSCVLQPRAETEKQA